MSDAAKVEETPVLSQEADEFDLAFDAHLKSLAGEEPAPTPEPKVEAPKAEEPKAEEPKADPPKPSRKKVDPAAEIEARIRAEEAVREKLAKEKEEAAKAADPAPAPEEDPEDKDFETEWPGISAQMKKRLEKERAAYQKELEALRAQMATLQQGIAPMAQQHQVSAQQSFNQQLATMHADWEEVLPKTIEWVNKQPKVLKAAYDHILDNGSPEDAAELINIFKIQTGYKPASAPDPTKEKRLEQMASVRTERTAPAGTIDKDDFDGAFEARMRQATKP